MSTYLNRLYDEYRRAAKVGMDVLDAAALENRELTAEEREKRDRAYDTVTSVKAEIDRVKAFEEMAEARGVWANDGRTVTEGPVGAESERYSLRDMFRNAIRNGSFTVDMTPSSEPELRALAVASGTDVDPGNFVDFLTIYQRTATPMLNPSIVNLVQHPNGVPLLAAKITADPSTGGTVTAEAATLTSADMSVSAGTVTFYKYGLLNLYSAELAQDNAVGLEQGIAFTTARQLSLDIGTHLTTGSGSGQPEGFLTNATNGGTATGTGTTYGTYFGYTDLVSLFYGLAEPYRANGLWMANATTIAQIRNERDTTGQPIWQPAMAAGQPETILGRPLYENPGMAAGSAAKSVAFGDFNRFLVGRVVPVRVNTSIDFKYDTDQLALRTIERVGAVLTDRAAIRYLVGAAV